MGEILNIEFQYPIWKNRNIDFFKALDHNAKVIANTLIGKQVQIVGIGNSGVFVGALMFERLFYLGMDVTLNIVQKPEVKHHHDYRIPESICRECVTLLVDDFVTTGLTLNNLFLDIKERIDEENIAVYLVNSYSGTNRIFKELSFNIKYPFICTQD